MRALLAGLPRTVWLLGAISLLNDAASDMIYPLVPLYVATVLMAGPRALGFIEGIAEAAGSLLKLGAGVLSDRIRRIKPFVVGGYGLAGIARPLIGITTSWTGVMFFRFVDRIGKGLRSAPRDAMLAASVSPQQRGLAYGLHRGMDNAGAVVGPLAAAALLAAGLSLRQVFLLAFVPAVLVMVMALRLREPAGTDVPAKLAKIDWRCSRWAIPRTCSCCCARTILALTRRALHCCGRCFPRWLRWAPCRCRRGRIASVACA
jgi:hypothetical protein